MYKRQGCRPPTRRESTTSARRRQRVGSSSSRSVCACPTHGMHAVCTGCTWNGSVCEWLEPILTHSKTQQATRLCGAASVWRRLGRGWRAHGTRSVPASLTWTNSRRGSQSPGATGLERPRVVLSCVDMGTCMARHTAAEPSAARACGAGPLARGGGCAHDPLRHVRPPWAYLQA